MTRTCLLVVDMLNDFLDRWDEQACQKLIQNTNTLIATIRRSGGPIIWVRQAFRVDLSDAFLEMRDKQTAVTIENTSGADIHRDLDCEPDDAIILKKRYSAFFRTNLDDVLAKIEPESLVLAGVNTHACIRMAAIDAYQRDYRVILATDCIDSHDEEHARVSLAYMKDKIAVLHSNAEIQAMLN